MSRLLSRVMALLFLAAASWQGTALESARAPAMELELGFEGHVLSERWAPLRIRSGIEAEGARFELLRLAVDGSESIPEYFPQTPGLAIECPVMVDATASSVRVRLLQSSLVLAEASLDTRAKTFPGHLVLLVGMDGGARQGVAEALLPWEPILALSLSPDRLPADGLDYDAVSALVLREPGASLSPAQRGALGSWIAGGGRLVLFGAGSDAPNFLASLGIPSAGEGGIRFGLGSVLLTSGEAPVAEATAVWKSLLDLPPFEDSRRLNPGRGFTGLDDPRPLPLEAFAVDSRQVLAIGAWALLALVLALSRHRRILPLALFSLAACAAGWLGGTTLLRVTGTVTAGTGTGTVTRTRLVLLPGGIGALAQIGILPQRFAGMEDLDGALVSRTVSFNYSGLDMGMLAPDGAASWTHHSARPWLTVRRSLDSSGPGGVLLEGLLPGEALRGSRALELSLAIADQDRGEAPPLIELPTGERLAWLEPGPEAAWWEWDGTGKGWERREFFPSWLEAEAAWLMRLGGATPGLGYLIGRGELPGLCMESAGLPQRTATWVLPRVRVEAVNP